MATLAEQIQGERMARVALSMIAEPNDPATGHVLAHVGAVETLRLIESDDPVPGLARADALMWRAQLAARIAPGLVRRVAETQGGEFRILIPVDNEWPAGLDDLGDRAPYLLWTRGAVSFLSTALSDRVTFTGSRASTSYGEHVTSELAAGLADEERIVVSGGAYGIETAAQRSALAAGGQTIGVLPNGLDLPYPSRRSDLLEQIGDVGLLLSELPPGTPPSKDRFTARNRLMAALAGATVIPEAGVRSGSITTILAARSLGRGVGAVPGPITKRRVTRSEFVRDEAAAHAFFDQLRISSTKGVDVSMTLLEFVTSIGDRWARGLDPTSTVDTYAGGLKLRVLPALGHLPIAQITAGMIDRTIDEWEKRHGASTIKNTIAPMVRVLDEAVRDGLLTVNPAKNRAKRSLSRNAFREQPAEDASPRAHAIKDLATLTKLADACGQVHQSYSDFVMLAALLAARSSEVSGLQVRDVQFDKNLVVIRRQIFPGKGGLITKPTKNRKERRVPILDPLRPVLERLTEGKQPEDQLLTGPRGGVLTTATVRDATNWDQLVIDLGLPNLTRHGLRHTGATWLADAGVPLHVLQEILGHASIETTRGYLHPDDRHLACRGSHPASALNPLETVLWSPFGPLIHKSASARASSTSKSAGLPRLGDQRGTTLGNEKALVRFAVSPGLLRRDDRI